MRVEELVDLAEDLHPRRRENNEVVTDPLEVGNQMRGQDNRGSLFGYRVHQGLEELTPSQRVEARNRLVEDQHLRAFRKGKRQCDLGPLAAGEMSARDRRSIPTDSQLLPAGGRLEPRIHPGA